VYIGLSLAFITKRFLLFHLPVLYYLFCLRANLTNFSVTEVVFILENQHINFGTI